VIDLLILSNGPGEVSTWVRPVVHALRQQFADARISLILSPCPNATGREVAIAQTFPELDRIQAAEHFWTFLLQGKTVENWDWCDRGIVIFLGGDQFFPIVIGKRLGYQTLIYGEWETRWHQWGDRFVVMNQRQVPSKYAAKFAVIGDLMADVTTAEDHGSLSRIALLPGSKAAKLTQGVPLCLAIAQHLHQYSNQIQFVLPVAPTLDLSTLMKYADPVENPAMQYFGELKIELIENGDRPILKTATGLEVILHQEFPAHEILSQCDLCLTTVGANTAEIGALGIPMFVLIPTQQLDAMRAWDGLPGLLANLPGVGTLFAKAINQWFLRKSRLLAWPNIWAGRMIVPELVGNLQPEAIATQIIDLLEHPEQLAEMRSQLRQVRGEAGAAQKLVAIAAQMLKTQ
jgi:lipid A disaccharide synthetase